MNLGKEFEQYAIKHRGISSNTLNDYNRHMVTNLTPNIIEERPMNIAVMDVYSRLMMDRIIFLGYPINDEVANIVTAQLLFLDSTDRQRDIQMYINSPGGSVYSGLGVYDTMQYVTPDVSTICIGMAASMGAVLLTAGAQGKRTALKHSRVMLHQPSGAIGGQASDIDITYLFGYGFPVYRGGPMFWAEQIGLDKVLATIRGFHKTHGKFWEPAPLLVQRAEAGKGWSDR